MITSRRAEFLYVAGRAAALFSRPAFLLVVNWGFGNVVAATLATAYLVSALLIAASAIDSHRVYYAHHFATERRSAGRAYYRYISSQLIIAIAAFVVCFGYFFASGNGVFVGIAAGLFFLSEKLADETLRFRLFQRDRAGWGLLMIVRITAQLVLAAVVVLAHPPIAVAGGLVIAVMFLGNALAFARWLPWLVLRRLMPRPWLIAASLRDGARLVRRSGVIWGLSFATAASAYLDRLIVLASRKDDLAAFTLVATSLSVVQTAVDYFYFSQRRRDFLEGNISFRDVILSSGFARVAGSALLVGCVLTLVNIKLYRGAPNIPILAIIWVAVMQLTLSASLIVREIAYWNNQLKALLRVEIVFLTLLAAIFSTLYFAQLNYVWLLGPAAAALIVRLALFARIPNERLPIH